MACSILGVVLGGVITIFVSLAFYKLAARDLKRDAQELRDETKKLNHLMNLGLRAIESGRKPEFKRDQSGEIIAMIVHFGGIAAARTETSAATLQVDDLVEGTPCAQYDERTEG